MCCCTCISLLTKTYFVQLATPKPHFFSRGAAPEALVGGCTPKPPPNHFLHPMGTPENHTLACLLHWQLNAPLKRFQKVFILLGLFISSQYFFFVTTRRTSSGSLRSMHLPHGIVCSLCTCLLKYPELWKVQVHTMRQGHWSSVSPGHRNLPSKVKKINRKKICKGKSSHWLQRGFVCSNTKYDLLERVLIHCFSEFLHSYMLHLMFTWGFVCSKALKMCGTLVLIYQYVLSYWMAQ